MSLLVKRGDSPQDRFAAEVLELFRSDGRVEDAWYDREQFAISVRPVGGTPVWANLTEVYEQWSPADPQSRAVPLQHFVDSTVEPPRLPETWDEARPLVRPMLHGVASVLPSRDEPESGPLWRRSLPYLAELIELDLPGGPRLQARSVDQWGVSSDEVFATARQNLAGRDMRPQPSGSTGPRVLRLVDDGGRYVVAHLLVDGWLASFGQHLGGRPVAFAPDRATLLIAADSPAVLSSLFEMVEEEYEQSARPVSPSAYTVDENGRVVPYAAPPGHPLYAAASRSERVLAIAEYGRQKRWLETSYSEDRPGGVMLAGRADGSIFSVASVTRGGGTLLPMADYIAVNIGEDLVFVPWAAAERIFSLKPEPDMEPPRFLVHEWHADGDMAANLRAAAVDPSASDSRHG